MKEKKFGIVADDYKLDKFKTELEAKGFLDYEILPYKFDTSLIRVNTTEDKVSEVNKICQLVELHFKRSN